MQAQEIAALVDRRMKLDQAARAIHIFEYASTDNSKAERRILDSMKYNLNHAQQAFDADVAALSEEQRWQFIFKCMVTGVFEEEFDLSI
jgi:hypothetical protein